MQNQRIYDDSAKESNARYYHKNKERINNRMRDYYYKRAIDPVYRLLKSTRQSAKARGLAHSITRDDIIVPTHCPLLNVPLNLDPDRGHDQYSPSLDRIDSSKGYVPGNVWVISRKANTMKWNASQEELLTFAKNVQKLFENNHLKVV